MDQSPANLYIHNITSVYSGYPNCFPGFHAHNLSVVSLKIKGRHIFHGSSLFERHPSCIRKKTMDYKKIQRWRLELKTSSRPSKTISLIVPLDGKVIFTYIPLVFCLERGWYGLFQKKTLTCSNLEEVCLRGRWKSCGFHEIHEARACHVSKFVHPKNRPMSFDEMSSLSTLANFLTTKQESLLVVSSYCSSLEIFSVVLQILWGNLWHHRWFHGNNQGPDCQQKDLSIRTHLQRTTQSTPSLTYRFAAFRKVNDATVTSFLANLFFEAKCEAKYLAESIIGSFHLSHNC